MSRLLDDLTRRTLVALPLLPAALFALLPKWLLLRDQGFLIAARTAGYVVPGDRWEDALGWADRIAFFRYDLLLNFIILPLLLIAATALLRPRWRAPFAGIFSAALVLLIYADMLSCANVGRYLSLSMMGDAARWAWANPHYFFTYISPSSLIKLLAILICVALLTLFVHRIINSPRRPARPRRYAPFLLLILLPAMTSCTGALSTLPATSLHRPVLAEMAAGLTGGPRVDAYDHLPEATLRAFYDQDTGTTHPAADPRYFAAAAGDDVLLFVFETGPARCLDLNGDLTGFPTLQRLRAHALIGAAHHSTYPYTSRALFSILSGAYPTDALDTLFSADRPPPLAGWPRALQADGYVTATFAPGHSQFTPDAAMLHSLGIAEEHVSRAEPLRAGGPWDQTLARDREALQMLLTEMDGWLTRKQHFAAIFMPQVGHGPWHDLNGSGDDWPARGRALMALQDQWLGEIVALLQRHGRLEHTVILVTADHGVRTRSEDPAFTGGMIDDYSFHVPLLVWSPSAFPRTRVVGNVTSHIDLAPTLLDLLGDRSARTAFQGIPLWEPALAKRRTYFFARGYLGADGLQEGGRWYMANYLLHSAYSADKLHFGTDELLRADGNDATKLFGDLERMEAIRTSWINRVLALDTGATP